jgi:hypothetical protein
MSAFPNALIESDWYRYMGFHSAIRIVGLNCREQVKPLIQIGPASTCGVKNIKSQGCVVPP